MVHKLAGAVVFVAGVATSVAAHAATITVPANGDLQGAINSAQPGDVILLQPGAVYVGNFVLPAKSNPNGLPITISSSASTLPGPGQRIMPAHASQLPKLRSANVVSVLQTAPGARFWTLKYLEFQANDRGYGEIIALGSGDPAVQTSLSQVPGDLVIDHCYIHGDAMSGQKRGIALNSGKTDIIDSYISDIKAAGFETQAIAGWNGPGPYRILNNYIEAAGINFLLGGADPGIPNLVPSNVEFKRNLVTKPVAWRQPILGTPGNVRISGAPGPGKAQETLYYTIVAVGASAMDTTIYSPASAEVSARVPKKGNATVSWNSVAGAVRYRVYRNTVANSQTKYFETTSTSFADTGANPPFTGSIPGTGTWTVKNLFELKNARSVVVDGNVLENNWTHAQTGYAVLFTVRNQDGTAPWSTVDTITFTNNIVRHAPGGINILGRDDLNPSDLVKNVVIRNNLFDDLTSAWGNNLPWLLLGNGADRLTIDHNTIVHAGPSLVLVYAIPTTNFVYTNNMARHNQYGFLGDGRAPGMDSINVYLPGAVLSRNIIVAANPAIYPPANSPCGTATCYPSETQWEASFMNFSGGNYRLLATSPYVTGGSGSTALGANIDAIVLASSGS